MCENETRTIKNLIKENQFNNKATEGNQPDLKVISLDELILMMNLSEKDFVISIPLSEGVDLSEK